VGIGLDVDEIGLYDFYNDTNEVKVWPYTIKNADKKSCLWYNTFLHALVFSCNVGMVRIANGDWTWKIFGIWKESFYNYLDKLWFWKLTNIELAWESEWFVESVSTVAVSRFLNNTFGQGLLTTPIQIVAGYWPLVNGWYYIKPTIVKNIFDKKTNINTPNQRKVLGQIFKPETSDQIKFALLSVMEQNPEFKFAKIEWYKLGGKSWTSQISFKWKYQQGIWWTNASFVGLITEENPKYIVMIQVRRPRSSLWWVQTAGKILWDISKFLINYSLMTN
jgi:cell division protein FtsI/penicillin-binding protein 2